MIADVGVGLVWTVLCGGLGVGIALACAVLLLQGKRVPPVLTGAAVALAAASGTVTGLLEGLDWDPDDLATQRIVAMTTAAARLLAVLPAGAAATFVWLALVVAAVRARPYRPGVAALAAAGCLACAGAVAASGFVLGDVAYSSVRAGLYGVSGVLVAVAMLAGDEGGDGQGNGAEVAATAGLIFPLLVAAGEGSRRGLVELVLLAQDLEAVALDNREPVVRGYFDATAAELEWSLLVLGISALVGLLGVARGAWRVAPERLAGSAAGLLLLPLALAILWLGDNGVERLVALVQAMP